MTLSVGLVGMFQAFPVMLSLHPESRWRLERGSWIQSPPSSTIRAFPRPNLCTDDFAVSWTGRLSSGTQLLVDEGSVASASRKADVSHWWDRQMDTTWSLQRDVIILWAHQILSTKWDIKRIMKVFFHFGLFANLWMSLVMSSHHAVDLAAWLKSVCYFRFFIMRPALSLIFLISALPSLAAEPKETNSSKNPQVPK